MGLIAVNKWASPRKPKKKSVERYLDAPCSLVPTVPNVVLTLEPTVVIAAIATTDTSAAKIAYSIMVAPAVSFKNRLMLLILFIILYPAFLLPPCAWCR